MATKKPQRKIKVNKKGEKITPISVWVRVDLFDMVESEKDKTGIPQNRIVEESLKARYGVK